MELGILGWIGILLFVLFIIGFFKQTAMEMAMVLIPLWLFITLVIGFYKHGDMLFPIVNPDDRYTEREMGLF